MSNKIYPIGIQNFEKIRKGGYCYIDKTAWIYQMVKTGSYYFLSRPRRFGEKFVTIYFGSLFSGEKRTFRRIGDRETGKRLDQISHSAFRSECGEIYES